MAVSHGADAGALLRIAAQLRVQAHRASTAKDQGRGQLRSLHGAWEGPDLENFAEGWQGAERSLSTCAERLTLMADLMVEQAEQQIEASGAGGGLVGAGGVGFPPAGGGGPGRSGGPSEAESTFDEDVRGTEGQPVDKDLWYLAFHSQGDQHPLHGVPGFGYDVPDLPEGYSQVSDDDIEALGLDPADFGPHSNPQAFLYQTPDGGYVVGFQGSVEVGDWVTNGRQALGFDDPQFQAAMELGAQVNEATGGNVTFTGHSLGGGLASAAALATGQPAVVFGASGVHPNTAAAAAEIRGEGAAGESVLSEASQGQIRAYTLETDGVTNGSAAVGAPAAPGTQIVMETPDSWQRDVVTGVSGTLGGIVGGVGGLFDGDPFDVAEDVQQGAEIGVALGEGAWGHSWDPYTEAMEERYPD